MLSFGVVDFRLPNDNSDLKQGPIFREYDSTIQNHTKTNFLCVKIPIIINSIRVLYKLFFMLYDSHLKRIDIIFKIQKILVYSSVGMKNESHLENNKMIYHLFHFG